MLGKGRWDAYDQWRDIATALKNSFGEEYCGAFERLSRISPKFDSSACQKLWASVARPDYSGARLTFKTLECWAATGDYKGLMELKASQVPPYVKDRIHDGDRGLAEIAALLMKDVVKRPSLNSDEYYRFDEETALWSKCNQASLRMPMSQFLQDQLEALQHAYSHACHGLAPGAAERERVESEREHVGSLIKYIQSCNGLNKVVSLASTLLHEAGFEQKLDSCPYLLGVRNGVVDLRSGAVRARTPQDLIHQVIDID